MVRKPVKDEMVDVSIVVGIRSSFQAGARRWMGSEDSVPLRRWWLLAGPFELFLRGDLDCRTRCARMHAQKQPCGLGILILQARRIDSRRPCLFQLLYVCVDFTVRPCDVPRVDVRKGPPCSYLHFAAATAIGGFGLECRRRMRFRASGKKRGNMSHRFGSLGLLGICVLVNE